MEFCLDPLSEEEVRSLSQKAVHRQILSVNLGKATPQVIKMAIKKSDSLIQKRSPEEGEMILTKEKDIQIQSIADILSQNMYHSLFSSHLELLPQVNEVYELQLALNKGRIA